MRFLKDGCWEGSLGGALGRGLSSGADNYLTARNRPGCVLGTNAI
jgi:hypothetical protein